jgi:hypothetical protein
MSLACGPGPTHDCWCDGRAMGVHPHVLPEGVGASAARKHVLCHFDLAEVVFFRSPEGAQLTTSVPEHHMPALQWSTGVDLFTLKQSGPRLIASPCVRAPRQRMPRASAPAVLATLLWPWFACIWRSSLKSITLSSISHPAADLTSALLALGQRHERFPAASPVADPCQQAGRERLPGSHDLRKPAVPSAHNRSDSRTRRDITETEKCDQHM